MTEAEVTSKLQAAIALRLAEFRRMPSAEQRLWFELGFIAGAIALFALLIPMMGIGAAPAITGLAAYSLMILIRNIGIGFQAIKA